MMYKQSAAISESLGLSLQLAVSAAHAVSYMRGPLDVFSKAVCW